MQSFETEVDYSEIKSTIKKQKLKNQKYSYYRSICLCILSLICIIFAFNVISIRKEVTHLQKKLTYLLDKNESFIKETSYLQQQIPQIQISNNELKQQLKHIQQFSKDITEAIEQTEKQNDKLMKYKIS